MSGGFSKQPYKCAGNEHFRIAFLTKNGGFSQLKYTTAFSAAKPASRELDLFCTMHEVILQTCTMLAPFHSTLCAAGLLRRFVYLRWSRNYFWIWTLEDLYKGYNLWFNQQQPTEVYTSSSESCPSVKPKGYNSICLEFHGTTNFRV